MQLPPESRAVPALPPAPHSPAFIIISRPSSNHRDHILHIRFDNNHRIAMALHWKEKGDFPGVPPSIDHKAQSAFEMLPIGRGTPANITSARSQSSKVITPYLGLRSRLSQVWLNKWTILILLVLVHFLLTVGSLNDNLGEAKTKALSACSKVEDVGSAFASMPHYLSVGVNELSASTITNAVQALMSVLDMILTGIEQLILFVIGFMTDTYLCLISMVVHGGLNASAIAVEKTTDVVNKAIDGVADGIASSADNIQNVIDKIYEAVDKAGDVFSDPLGDLFGRDELALIQRGLLPDKPDLGKEIVDKMNELKAINIDTTGFVQGLDKLNEQLPTFDELKDLTKEAVSIPFDLIRKEINESYGDWKFDEKVFPVAQKETLSFCSDNDGLTKFFERLFKIAYNAKIAAIVILVLLAIGVCVPMYILEKRRWRRQHELATHAVDILDYGYMYSSPLAARTGLAISHKIGGKSEPRKIMTRWFVSYATSLPALFVLSLALAGFFSCAWQAILLRTIENEVPALSQQVGDFAGDVVQSLTDVSQKWSDDANGVLLSFSSDINDDILGKVTNGTAAINETLNTFLNEIDKGLNAAFGDTLFKDLVAEVVRCLLGLKIESVQKGLTWVHDHAHIDFPMFPNNIFSVGAGDSIGSDSELKTFLASPSSVTTDEITGAVEHVTNWLRSQIIQEALISTGLLLIYVVVVLLAVMRAMYVLMTPSRHTFSEAEPPEYPDTHRPSGESSTVDPSYSQGTQAPVRR
ncbi:putative plasma membrane fusion protein PRM1 [Rosellinia necatrix]|uniref:Plasma membrane fusion protein PRM1 n=1 Tax=Rosellinia necatrix TaxID=77044 RepID=A0A1W2TP35_ROSNE|nr:putative plasma membrane fusion protein PRM1 [Rosellinia necatrix]